MEKLFILIFLLLLPLRVLASDGGAQHIQLGPYFNSAGTLYSSIKIYHYSAGTTTNKNCWSDESKTTAVASPFIGDTSGVARMFCDGDYKLRIDDTDDNTLYTWDNVKITSDTATMWEGNEGTAYPSCGSSNGWQLFAKHTAGNVFEELGTCNETSFDRIASTDTAFKDEANTFTADQRINASLGINIAPSGTAGDLDVGTDLTVTGLTTTDTLTVSKWPCFSVDKNAASQINITGNEKITWPSENFDTNNNFASDRFTPTVAGKYLLSGALAWFNYTANDLIVVQIRKNGVSSASGRATVAFTETTVSEAVSSTKIFDANGTTDFFEIFGENVDRDTSDVNGTVDVTYFSGCRIG